MDGNKNNLILEEAFFRACESIDRSSWENSLEFKSGKMDFILLKSRQIMVWDLVIEGEMLQYNILIDAKTGETIEVKHII